MRVSLRLGSSEPIFDPVNQLSRRAQANGHPWATWPCLDRMAPKWGLCKGVPP
jgi:hypothetical protein